MAGKSGGKAAAQIAEPEDLEGVVLEMLRTTPGLKGSEFKKKLPASHAPFNKKALEIARALAERGQAYRLMKGRTETFFPVDPFTTLDGVMLAAVASAPLADEALKTAAAQLGPAYQALFAGWLKSAIARRLIFKHRGKRSGAAPDLSGLLGAVSKALSTALVKTDAEGIPRQAVANELLSVLGLPLPRPPATSPQEPSVRDRFLQALAGLAAENPREALLSVRDLRARLELDKNDFDAAALALMREGKVTLHQHDHPASLPELERAKLVKDERDTHYVGIAIRGAT